MARARNIKPGFYKNEELAECSIWARFIFPGLWQLADREGRLEDRPKRIKGELLPFDSQDVNALLNELQAHGFILRYRNEDGAFIQILKFSDHQSPHYSEKPSVIKPPISENPQGTKKAIPPEKLPDEAAEPPRKPPEDAGKISCPQGLKRGSQPPDSLNPDSLNPESLQALPGVRNNPPVLDQPLALAEAKLDPQTPAAILASVCVANSIRATAFHPLVVEWARDGVTIERLKAAIAKARLSKGETAQIPVAYLDPILRDESKPIDTAWRSDDTKAEELARQLGIRGAKAGEQRLEFHARIQQALSERSREFVHSPP